MRDTDAAEFVAAHRNGDLEVPTVVTGAGDMIDATASAIKAQLETAR